VIHDADAACIAAFFFMLFDRPHPFERGVTRLIARETLCNEILRELFQVISEFVCELALHRVLPEQRS
jgi:hypothetical protein